MNAVMEIIKNTNLTYHQQLLELAAYAENTLKVSHYSRRTQSLLNAGIVCTMFEGNAPYRPRYIAPDYDLLMEKGCAFLELKKPTDIWEAVNTLLIFYKHVPSITSFPVYLGNIDRLFEPFVDNSGEARRAILFFLQHIDKTLTDSFVHANIGPYETNAGHIILDLCLENSFTMPNITFKYDRGKASNLFVEKCCKAALLTAKPSFANHRQYIRDFGGERYAIASCYNGFHVGGGGHTLVRLVLNRLAETAVDLDDFMKNKLPKAVGSVIEVLDERIRFATEEAAFWQSNFLVKEDFIKKALFKGMFGIVGLAEAVNLLLGAEQPSDRFGHSDRANALGLIIIEKINQALKRVGDRHVLHAQVGIREDRDCSPGCRIPVGEEPELIDHILQSAPFHKYFHNGIGDIFVMEETYLNNLPAMVKMVDGAFSVGIRYTSFYGKNSDLVRVTGYLAKRSEVEKFENGEAVVNNAVVFASGAKNNGKAFDRKVRV